ncbi:hypothetical protein [Vibrio harveyi]|uniref:hypothetical protein n=1 Tax=Vibrio harveyi TaxID=669 RepID=UPI003CF6F9C4
MNPEEIQAIDHQIAVFSVFVEELHQKTKSGEIINSSFLARKLGSFKELKGLLEAV